MWQSVFSTALGLGEQRALRLIGGALIVASLAACSSTRLSRAPVEDRGRIPSTTAPSGTLPGSAPVDAKPLPPGWENAGKPGYYSVKPGDTLMRISLESGQHWRELVRWNNLTDPNKIEVGQVLRVVPPGADPGAAVPKPVPLPSSGPAASLPGAAPTGGATAKPPASAGDELEWAWPTQGGRVIANFGDKVKRPPMGGAKGAAHESVPNNGVDIAGHAGDGVYAAADGVVAIASSALRGYGNLIIIKHNSTYLSAYAHNKTLLVKENDSVRKGQKIAEMGDSDADQVKLHFEIRREGKAVDPGKYLSKR